MGESSTLPIGGMRADLGVEEGSARMGGLLVSSSESSGTVVNDVATVVNDAPTRPAITASPVSTVKHARTRNF
jgi:hypothetical protein